ncbi:MAG: hypothetical protein GXY61_00475 [Lentisphaerae bacterium]|nr:hypothetical protein [Lentisphaerota bacterium]
MSALNGEILLKWISPEPRLPWLTAWLLNEVWTAKRFEALTSEDYLVEGERAVHEVEEMMAASADQTYDELASASIQSPALFDRAPEVSAVVVFDGASLREIPLLLAKAKESGFRVVERSYGLATLPSTTTAFVGARLIGKEIGPKTLPQRKELKEKGVLAFYLDDAISTQHIQPVNGERLLVWSAFPDNTYKDSDARFARHFADMKNLFDAAWRNTIMQIPRGRRIVITSDHGYIFFGAGFDSTRPNDACALLDQDRHKYFREDETLPDAATEPCLQVVPEKRLAMLRGRIKNRPRGPSSNKVYRHGGLSLMEMLTPWIVLEKE